MKDLLKEEYGINEGQTYFVSFRTYLRIEDFTIGKILNFCPSQLVLKNDNGLYIINPSRIIELRPIQKAKNK